MPKTLTDEQLQTLREQFEVLERLDETNDKLVAALNTQIDNLMKIIVNMAVPLEVLHAQPPMVRFGLFGLYREHALSRELRGEIAAAVAMARAAVDTYNRSKENRAESERS